MPRRKKLDTSKAELIRQTARSMRKPIRPRDVVAEVAKQGVTVTPQQVSTTLREAGFRRRRRRRKGGRESVDSRPVDSGLSLEALLAAKAMIEKVGSVDAAQAAISALKKLQ